MCFKNFCEKRDIKDSKRFKWFFWIFILSLFSFLVFYLYKERFFYNIPVNGIGNIYRFLWTLPFSFMGFSFLALLVSRKGLSPDTRPWLSYIFNYFPRLIALSLIIFSVLHLFEATSGHIYYFFSAGLSLYLGYNIDFIKIENIVLKS